MPHPASIPLCCAHSCGPSDFEPLNDRRMVSCPEYSSSAAVVFDRPTTLCASAFLVNSLSLMMVSVPQFSPLFHQRQLLHLTMNLRLTGSRTVLCRGSHHSRLGDQLGLQLLSTVVAACHQRDRPLTTRDGSSSMLKEKTTNRLLTAKSTLGITRSRFPSRRPQKH